MNILVCEFVGGPKDGERLTVTLPMEQLMPHDVAICERSQGVGYLRGLYKPRSTVHQDAFHHEPTGPFGPCTVWMMDWHGWE